MASHRQQILDSLSGRLLQITPGKIFRLPGGDYICGSTINKVQPWRKNPYTVAELPAIAWRDKVTKMAPACIGASPEHQLRIIFAAYHAGATAVGQARGILADMLAAIGSDPTCGGLVRSVTINKLSIALGQQADVIAGARLDMTAVYAPAFADSAPVGENTLMAGDAELAAGGVVLEW